MTDRVRFKKPPVTELVCGVSFAVEGQGLLTVDFGMFGLRVNDRFPGIHEAPPIDWVPDPEDGQQAANMVFHELPPLRRVWYVSEDGRQLIQLQADKFLFNWKRDTHEESYPSYDNVIVWFEEQWSVFEAFFKERNLGVIQQRQFELTYVNIISGENGLDQVGHGAILADHVRHRAGGRYLPEPEGYNWNAIYRIERELGRLHFQARRARRRSDNADVMRIDFTARGFPASGQVVDARARRAWFDAAHNWITFSFRDATSDAAHEIWEMHQ